MDAMLIGIGLKIEVILFLPAAGISGCTHLSREEAAQYSHLRVSFVRYLIGASKNVLFFSSLQYQWICRNASKSCLCPNTTSFSFDSAQVEANMARAM